MPKITCKLNSKKCTFNYITKLEQLKSYVLTCFIELPQQFVLVYHHNEDCMIIENQKDLDKIMILNPNQLNLDIQIENASLDFVKIAVCQEIQNIIQNVSDDQAVLNFTQKQSRIHRLNGRENSICFRESRFSQEHESRLLMEKKSKKLIRISPKKDHQSISNKIQEMVIQKFNKIFDDLVQKSYDKIVQIDSQKCLKQNREYDSIIYNQIIQRAIKNTQNPQI